MGMARLGMAVVALIAAPLLASDLVSYQLQINGDNHVDDVKAGTRTAYTDGITTNGANVPQNSILNWAANVSVTGIHSQPGHPSDGLAPQGVANMVLSVELHQGTAAGPLVGSFFSNIHSGAGALPCTSCAGGGGVCAGSAFALAWFIPDTPWPAARVTEAASSGAFAGPFMEVCMWPTVQTGKLLGTGAGYASWCRGCGLGTTTTKGIGIPTASGGLGTNAVVEGQIDLTGLPLGTYVLKLIPGAGNNVLRGDVDLVTAPGGGSQVQAFAVAANATQGSEISFNITSVPQCTAPTIVSAVSRKTHGASGDFDVDIKVPTAVEDRANGPTKLVVTFDQNVIGVGGLDVSDVQLMNGTVSNVSIAGAVLTIDMSGSPNQTQEYVGFSGISSTTGSCICTQTLCLTVLNGDVTGDKNVNVFDLVTARNSLNQATNVGNFRGDVNTDASVNVLDLVVIRNRLNQNASGSCQ